LLAIGGISLASLGPTVEKWLLKVLESSLELEIICGESETKVKNV